MQMPDPIGIFKKEIFELMNFVFTLIPQVRGIHKSIANDQYDQFNELCLLCAKNFTCIILLITQTWWNNNNNNYDYYYHYYDF